VLPEAQMQASLLKVELGARWAHAALLACTENLALKADKSARSFFIGTFKQRAPYEPNQWNAQLVTPRSPVLDSLDLQAFLCTGQAV